MIETKQTLTAFRLTRGKPHRRVTEAEFRLACARLRWPEQAVTVLVERSGPGVWWEVGHELLGVYGARRASVEQPQVEALSSDCCCCTPSGVAHGPALPAA